MISYLSMMMLQRSPLLLVVMVGIVLAIARWTRHPKISFFTLFGLVLYLLKLFLFTELSYNIPRLRESMHLSYAAANNLYTVLVVLNEIAFAGVMILLVIVAFAQRTPVTVIDRRESRL